MGAIPSAESMFDLAESRVGRVLRGKYTIEGVLGVGGMAVVYRARHRNQKLFAIKMLHPEYMARTDVHARFVREGYVANSVGHSGVVSVLDDDVDDDGYPYLVMELLEGATVESLCPPGDPPIPVREALAIVYQLLDVLACAHDKGIVHRDIKPANLFVSDSGELKVLDFGVARLRDTSLDAQAIQTSALLGTPGFMAPEQAQGTVKDVDHRTDLWAVGATLFTMLSGRLVHEGDNSRQVAVRAATEPARSLAAVAPEVPPSVVRAVSKALMFDRSERWQSAASMRDYVHGVHLRLYGDLSLQRVATLVAVSRRPVESRSTERSQAPESARVESQEMTVPSALPCADGDSTTPISKKISGQLHRAGGAYRSLSALGLALAALFLIEANDTLGHLDASRQLAESAPLGDMQVSVSANLKVPAELDWLSWRVWAEGRARPVREGSLDLGSRGGLPVRFTALSAGDPLGRVEIEIIGKKGGEFGVVQAKRRVRARLARYETKALDVHLEAR